MSKLNLPPDCHTAYRIIPLFMWIKISMLLAGLLISGVHAEGTLQPYRHNEQSMDFTLSDLKGTAHTLAEYRGKVVAVNFWASWCPPCIKELPGMQRLQQDLANEPFVMLPVNVAEKKYHVWKFTRLIDFTLPVLLDTHSKTFSAWNANVLPTSFLLDTEGRIRYRVQGDIEWNSEEVITIIESLMHEKQENAQ